MQRYLEFQKIKRKSRAVVRKNAKDSDVIKRHFDQIVMILKNYKISSDDT
jgi:hypothetical protein